MTHFTATVIVPKDEAHDLDNYITKVMEPYCENDEWGREGSHWDWYVIGGRWSGYFKNRPDTPILLGQSGAFDNAAPEGHSDVIRQADVDWEGMAYEAQMEARAYWVDRKASGRPLSYMALDGMDVNDLDEDAYAVLCTDLSTHALVDKTGEWRQPSQMVMFGMNTEPEIDQKTWGKQYVETIGSCDEDDLLVMLDCHV